MLAPTFPYFPELSTERLILRAHISADAPALFSLRTSDEVMRYIDRERPKEILEIEAKIQLINESFETNGMLIWVIAFKDSPLEMIGEIGFYRTDYANHRAEIGYMVQPAHWRKGVISEALKKVIDFGFQTINLHSISANINPGNDASRQILLKHGFVKEAYFKEHYYFNGKFLDSEIYGL